MLEYREASQVVNAANVQLLYSTKTRQRADMIDSLLTLLKGARDPVYLDTARSRRNLLAGAGEPEITQTTVNSDIFQSRC